MQIEYFPTPDLVFKSLESWPNAYYLAHSFNTAQDYITYNSYRDYTRVIDCRARWH
jgi:hypothetical protein